MQNFLLEAGAAGGQPSTASLLGSMWPLLMMIVVFYFILIRPNKKKEKETAAMRNSIEVGDEIITSGGIVGRVVIVKDDTLIIESGSANTKMRIAKWAVHTNQTANENARERQMEAARLKEEEKNRAKEEKAAKKNG